MRLANSWNRRLVLRRILPCIFSLEGLCTWYLLNSIHTTLSILQLRYRQSTEDLWSRVAVPSSPAQACRHAVSGEQPQLIALQPQRHAGFLMTAIYPSWVVVIFQLLLFEAEEMCNRNRIKFQLMTRPVKSSADWVQLCCVDTRERGEDHTSSSCQGWKV